MHVVYDHQIFSLQEYGGISRYFCELASRLAGRDDCRTTVVSGAHRNAFLRARAPHGVVGGYLRAVPHTYRARRTLNEALTSAYVGLARPQVLHETYYSARSSRLPVRTRRVVTVYDMIHERFPEHVAANDATAAAKAAAVARADHVVCISERTRRDLVEMLGVAEARTSVIHLGIDAAEWSPAAAPSATAERTEPPYLLYVGLRAGYKNFEQLLHAVASRPALQREYRIVCVGGGALGPAEQATISRLGLPADMVEQRAGDDRVLADLYRRAAAFVYPSRYEGFGLPVLEAMVCECPVVCSDGGSLPEVVGDAAELFDPDSPEALATALDRVLGSPARAAELRAAGLERATHFTWARCADRTLAAYRALV